MKNRFLFLVFVFSIAWSAALTQVQGPSPVIQFADSPLPEYTFTTSINYSNWWFEAVGGQVETEERVGNQYKCTVRWLVASSSNSVRLWRETFANGQYINVIVSSKTVVVNGATPPTPSGVSMSSTQVCGYTTVSRNASPPAGAYYSWYWQGSPTGTDASTNASSFNAYQNMNLYLRARSDSEPYNWSSSSLSMGAVSVLTIPAIAVSTSSQTLCSGVAMTAVSLSNPNSVPGTALSWTVSAPNISGASSGSGSSISQTLSQSTNVNQTATYTATATANGCSSSTTSTVTVKPIPTISLSTASQAICSGNWMSGVTISNPNGVSGTSFNWTVSAPNISGASTGSGSAIYQLLSQSTTSSQTATYTVTATANSCSSNSLNSTVEVRPVPTVAVTISSQTICSEATMASVGISNPNGIPGTSFGWTVSAPSISGASQGTGSSIAQTLTQSTTANQTATYSAYATANGCSSSTNSSVTVKPKPTVAVAITSQSICSGNSISGIYISNPNGISGTTFSWTYSAPNISGASSGSGNIISQTLSQTTNTNQTATYTATASYNGCSSSTTSTATVKPIPTVVIAPAFQSICSGSATSLSISNPNGVSGTTFSWTVSASGITGASPGTGSAISQTLSQSTTGNLTATYTVTPVANSCSGTTTSATVTVHGSTTSGSIQANQTICSGSTPATLTNSASPSGGSGTYTYLWEQSSNGSSWGNATGVNTGITYSPPALSSDTYYRRKALSCGSYSPPTSPVFIQVDNSVGGSVGASVEAYGTASGSVTLSSAEGLVQRWEEKIGTGSWTPVTNTTNTQAYTNITSTKYFRAVVKDGVCPEVPSSAATIAIYPLHTVSLSGNTVIPPGGSTSISTTSGLYSYTWYLNNVAVSGATSYQYTATKPGLYKVIVKQTSTSPTYTTSEINVGSIFNSAIVNMNYVVSTDILKEGVSDVASLYDLPKKDYSQQINYFDGLGRPVQSVTAGASPSGYDMVQVKAYDAFGRETTQYLPYAHTALSGAYRANGLTEQLSFYNNSADKVADDANPYSVTTFEPSPLNRVVKQGAPGAAWQPDGTAAFTSTDHTVKFAYEFNTTGEVLDWTISYPAAAPLGLVSSGTYAANELRKTKTKNEDGNIVIEYKDKFDRVILKRVQAVDNPASINDVNYASTYYVYNDLGNLVCVIPPQATKLITQTSPASEYNGKTDTQKNDFLARWAFRYVYDNQNRLIQKQVPGASAVYTVYDNRDRVVLTQDGNLRAANQWTFTKYDQLNRPVMTGIYTHGSSVDQATMSGLISTTNFYETYNGGGSPHGYTTTVFPTSNLTVHSVTYYDNYNFRTDLAGSSYNYTANDLPGLPAAPYDGITGLVTGTKTNVLGSSDYLWSVTYYDDKYRTIQVKAQNYKGGIDRVTTKYDFAGKVLKTRTHHSSAQIAGLVTMQSFEYDHAGRPLKTYQSIVSNPSDISWTNQVGVTVNGTSIGRSVAGSGWGVSGAFSTNSISANKDGVLEFSVNNNNTVSVFGLSDTNVDAHFNTIDYGIHTDFSNLLYVYESGTLFGPFGTYAIGDLFTVERKGGTINYKKNNSIFYTSTLASTSVLYADCSFYNTTGSIVNINLQEINEILLASNQYNEVGQLVDKNLAGAIANYNQSVDYRYNIRGWITSINNAQLDNAAATNNDNNDLFGMELLYNGVDGTLSNAAMYNGNISAVKWKTPVHGVTANDERKSYKFDYDAMSRLESATYGAYKTTASNWSAEANAFNESMSYDMNGNISSLQRNKATAGGSAFSIGSIPMDDLYYTYANGNQLSQVDDLSADLKGFKDGASASNEYEYDANGNLKKDQNKAITSITYNHLNLPGLITFSNGNTIQYTYDAAGVKLKQTVTEGGVPKVTDYIGGIVYEQDVLKFFSTPEGRAVNNSGNYEWQFMLKDHLGNTRVLYGNPFEGNNLITNADCNSTTGFVANQNVTITSITDNGVSYVKGVSNQSGSTPGIYPFNNAIISVLPGEKYTLKIKGYSIGVNVNLYVWANNNSEIVWPGVALPKEKANEGWVSQDFVIPDGVTGIAVGALFYSPATGDQMYLNEVALFKHKDDDHPAGFEVANQTNEDNLFDNYNTGKINNSSAYARTGTSSYRLTASTQITNEVVGPAKSIKVHPGDVVNMEVWGKYLTTTGSGTNVGSVIASALQGAFGLSAGGGTEVAYQSIGNLFGAGSLIGTGGYPYQDPNVPKAFLNYILFDDNYVPYDFGYDQIGSTGAIPSSGDKMKLTAKVRKPGYIYIYLSNENAVTQEVFFDDLAIKHVKGVAEQQSEYYPFGMSMNSFQRENSSENKYQYNGIEKVTDFDLGWYTAKYRTLDPSVGRWIQIDPKVDDFYDFTPYNSNENNPILNADPNGDCPWCIVGGAVIGGIAGGLVAYANGQDTEGIAIGALGGAAGGAILGLGATVMATTALGGSAAGIVITNAASGFLSGIVESTTTQGLNVAVGNQEKVNTADVVKSGAVGMVSNVVAGPVSKVITSKVSSTVVKSTTQQVVNATSKETQKALRKEVTKTFSTLSNKQVTKEVNKMMAQKVARISTEGAVTKAAAQTTTEIAIETGMNLTSDAAKNKLSNQ